MTAARQWTREALDLAHPEVAAAGWEWALWDNGNTPTAVDGQDFVTVADGRVFGLYQRLPLDVALAVILASRGMDSLGTMADALDERAQVSSSTVAAGAMLGAAAMLRRGTVKP
jgi:hypothetical protein